ncbi:sensor histidine kinase [Heyndrickxia sporothermodurans]|uniref:sensor histidine kinase n=1 Tax=Heyndrickxia sporothermodurans TaxID=46224 RepID=UPI002DBFC17C|nr:sensor histidine kinase [Heyndrickxia sporothermodurans]MEB6548699.1 sensor histidine kinase [Heyndrickxia sporothermodurans]MED3650664.1 sensor histidine kinase [Heyndrickxia sporothermodurans]MED3653674.1 sensor histidine kinase [Heyndrickxia sporothermodurans]MED3697428.1 sensor histidine kinase [Heyndrickxia sporothermodurans]MED3780742.1 sensor histidine kinase [Heyndrickxia sporothermodurans]
MEFWIILNKVALIVFIAVNCIRADSENISWVVLASLIYFCINITLYIFKHDGIKKSLLLLSIILTIWSYISVYSLFIILLPLSVIELISRFTNSKSIILLLTFIPIIYIQFDMQPIYGLVAVSSFMVYIIATRHLLLMNKSESQLDLMRKNIQKLTKHLNENKEYIRQSEYTVKLEERNRISQEIHDKIGHSMTGALIQMEAAKRLMELDKEKAEELLQNAINISKEGIENIRMTLKNLKPPTEQVGIHRMKLFIDEFSAKHELNTTLTHNGNLDTISPIQWKIIHENVTEALTNTMKYSDASHVSVDIKVLNKLIRVEVKDNGKGADKIKKGLGIIGMEERTAAINGKIIVDSTHGFSVTTLLPIQ